MLRPVFSLMEQVFVRGLPTQDAARIILATVPNVIVLTIPMSLLFGVLIAVGRMNSDSEIIAIQAAGIPVRRLLRPILFIAIFFSALNAYLSVDVIPQSSRRLRDIKNQVFASGRNIGYIEPRVFYEDFPNLLLYVDDVDSETSTWSKVLVYDSSEVDVERLTLAQRGRIVVPTDARSEEMTSDGPRADGDPWLLLEGVVTHEFLRGKPGTYRVNANQRQIVRLPGADQGNVTYRLAMRERDTGELLRYLQSGRFEDDGPPRDEESARRDRRLAGLELHRRMAIPAASLAFALLALPLGVGSRSGTKGRGFVLSILVVVLYYIATNNGELLALRGRVPPWLGMWFPNIALSVAAIILMTRMGRWLGERDSAGWMSRVAQWWSQWRHARMLRGSGRLRSADDGRVPLTGSIPVKLLKRRYASRFPTLFDRHLTRRMISPLLLVLLSTSALYIVVDLSGNLDDIANNKVAFEIALSYYVNLVPQVIMDVLPIGLMIAVLILLTLLERQRELTAFKGAGISLYRVMVPVVIMAMVAVGCMWFLGESIVPRANRDAKRLLDRIKGQDTPRSYRVSDRLWLLSRDGTTFYKFLRYDEDSRTLVRFAMFRFDESMNLRFHLSTSRARYENGAWVADSGWFRQFFPDGTHQYRPITGSLELGIPEGPSYFGQEYRRPGEMSFRDLGAYIQELVESGYRPIKLIVRYHQKFAYPLSALILVLLALPYGLNRGGRRASAMQGVAIALGLGIGYFVLVSMFEKMGEAELLPPALGAWSPVVLATLFAINRMTTLRT